jgi:glycosyltransferase involved in cell wall biosynthesis
VAADPKNQRRVMMLGTFGLRPKATLRSRAIAIAHALEAQWSFRLMTTPWDHPSDAGRFFIESGVPVLNTKSTRPILFPLAAAEMFRETNRFRPTLLHLFKPKGIGDVAARWLSKTNPVVVDMDDWEGDGGWNEIGEYGPLQRRIFDWQERTWPRAADAITVASRELERRAITLGARPESVRYVPNGLSRERFNALAIPADETTSCRARYCLRDRRVILLYTRFVEFDPLFAVRVLARVRAEIDDAVLFVVGASATGHAERSIRDAMAGSDLKDSIIFAGFVEPNEISALISMGDVAIHPFEDNLVNRSKCSVKLLELMASGRAIVSNPVGQNSEMIVDDATGYLSPTGDAEAMADRVIALLRDNETARAIGTAARARVEGYYLWDHLADRVSDAYERAVSVARTRLTVG